MRKLSDIDIMLQMGYCKVSSKVATVSRIDTSRFLETLHADATISTSLYDALLVAYSEPMPWQALNTERYKNEMVAFEDYYRRILSMDVVTGLTIDEFNMFPPSGETITGYATMENPYTGHQL